MNLMELDYYDAFLKTAPLWKGKAFGMVQFEIPMVNLTTFTSSTIPKNIRLGHQIEHLFLQLIKHSNVYTVLIQNVAIRTTERTLGELDFILENNTTKQVIHVELTYKFYIVKKSNTSNEYTLVGPNKSDAFLHKKNKIKNTQFPLLYTPEAKKILRNYTLDSKNIIQQTCFKTQLFIPYKEVITINNYNNNCIVGYWLYFSTFSLNEFANYQFYIPIKKEWILAPHKNVTWKSYKEIYLLIKNYMQKHKSPMLWCKKTDSVFEKFFIVWW